MKNTFTIICILLAVCSMAYSVNVHAIKKPREFVRALNTVNKECNAINIRHLKAVMATDPAKVDLAQTQAKIDELLDDVEKLEHILPKLRLGPRQRKGLTTKLGNLRKKIQMKAASLNSMTENSGCFGQKSIFNSHLAKAESTFNTLLEQFDELTEQCKVFSKPCVNKFTHMKEKFTKLNSNNVQPSKGKLNDLKKSGCFVSQTDRASYSKKMLDIECRVEGMILFVQSSLKNLLHDELVVVGKMKTDLESLLVANTSMAADVAGKKVDTRAIHLKIKDIFHQSIVLKKRFIIVYDCIYDVRGWIIDVDYETLHLTANSMYWDLGNLCVNIDNDLAKWDQLEKQECFTEDVNAKAMEVDKLKAAVTTTFDAIGSAESAVCGTKLETALTETDKIKVKLGVCTTEATKMMVLVNKELISGPEKTAILLRITNEVSTVLTEQTKTAEKNHYFLRIFDHLYCLDD